MSKNDGGAQPVMRDTTILSDTGFLGPHSPVLSVGDTQSLMFKAEDSASKTQNMTSVPKYDLF